MRMSRRPLSAVLALLASPVPLLLASPPAFSDAGMWTFHDFPRELVKGRYGADLSPAWLERVRTATARLSNCTASFVSPDGLMLTNHHCAAGCLDEHSSPEHNLLHSGFLARTRDEELKCGTQVADVLMGLEEVTAAVQAAIRGLDARSANDTRKKTLTQLEQTCEQQSRRGRYGPLKCESVDLYQGGQYWLYKYRRYQDVRLVFAPERDIAASLVPGHVGAARLHGRRQARRDAGVPAHPARGAAGRRSGIRLRAPGHDRSPAQRRGARDAQKRRPAALAAARRGAARPLHRVREDRRRGEPHRRGPAELPRERHQGAAQAARCAAR
ncbi:MAG: S46 family peptidase [Gammaproteobacteria bacterium]|nr:MAG: S46 family peptidase [Gammaproteobacteria bacterium]